MNDSFITQLGLIAAVTVPLWNIPLIARIIKRKSSQDVSLFWAIGVWVSFLAMLPSGLFSEDVVWRAFNIVNFALFSGVVMGVCFYRITVRA